MKYAPSALLGRLSRSAGSTTAAHNRYGAYLRNRVIPVNPVTPAQTDVRTNFGNISSGWRDLTEAERTAWNNFGAGITRTDTLGQQYTLNGQTAFISLNRNAFTYAGAGAIITQTPPVLNPPNQLLTTTITMQDDAVFTIAYTATPLPAATKLAVFATRPLSPGINFQPKSAFKLVHVSAAAAASPADIEPGYTSVFGITPQLGEKVLLKFIVIKSDGQASSILDAEAICTAAP